MSNRLAPVDRSPSKARRVQAFCPLTRSVFVLHVCPMNTVPTIKPGELERLERTPEGVPVASFVPGEACRV